MILGDSMSFRNFRCAIHYHPVLVLDMLMEKKGGWCVRHGSGTFLSFSFQERRLKFLKGFSW